MSETNLMTADSEPASLTAADLLPVLEAYLFVSVDPVVPTEVARTLAVEAALVEEVLEDLVNDYRRRADGGLQIVRLAHGYQISTRPELALQIARLMASPKARARLSKPALETLAIVAYQQPVTVAEIEAVRGVSADGVLKTLMDRKMIREEGRKAVPGRPIVYGTTEDFLHHFGLNSLEDLPPLEDVVPADDENAEAQALKAVGLDALSPET